MAKPLLYLSRGFWCIAPYGNRNHPNNIVASKTFEGAAHIARQCYWPLKTPATYKDRADFANPS